MSEFANGNDFNASSSGVGAYIVESPTQVSPIDTMIKAATFRENFELKKAVQQQREAEKQKAFVNKLATFDTKGIFPADQEYATLEQNKIIEEATELTAKYGVGTDISPYILPKVNKLRGNINALKTRYAEANKNLNDANKALAEGKINANGDKTRKAFEDWYALPIEQRIATPPPTVVINTKTLVDFANDTRKIMKPKTELTVNPDGSTITRKGVSDEELAIRTQDVDRDPEANKLMMAQFDSFPEEVKKAYIEKSTDPKKNPYGLEPYQIKFNDDLKVTNGLEVTGIGETPEKRRGESNAAYANRLAMKKESELAGMDLPEMKKLLGGGTANWILDNSSPVGEKIMALPGVVLTGKDKEVFAIPKVGLVNQVVNGQKVAIYKIYSTAKFDDKDTEKEGQYYIHRTANPTEVLRLIELENPSLFKKAGSYAAVYNHINKNYGSAKEGEELGLNRLINDIGKNAQLEKTTKEVPKRRSWGTEKSADVGVKGSVPIKKKTDTNQPPKKKEKIQW